MLNINRIITIETFFSAFTNVFEKGYAFNGERHNFWELVYVVDGCIGVAEDDKIYELKAGDIVFHKPMEFHRLWTTANTSPKLIIMSFSIVGNGMDTLENGVFKLDKDGTSLLFEALEAVESCRQFEDEISNQLSANCLEKCLLHLLRNQSHSIRPKKTIGTQNYKSIIKVMNENLDKNLNIPEIAKMCGLSESNLKKTFKKFSGVGVIKYYNNLKITKAMSMISEGYPISYVSEQLGFSSPNYFCDAFKRQCKMTPTEYKNQYEKLL